MIEIIKPTTVYVYSVGGGNLMQTAAQRLKLDELCGVNSSSCLVETAGGYALFQTDLAPVDGRRILLCAFGRLQFAVVMGGALITEDGECIEGDALDEVVVMGVVTFFINGATAFTDENPVM